MTAGLNLQQRKHTPLVLVETANLPEEKWLSYRRRGIGGSDVAAIMGISPFRTARDLYYDKLNIAPIEEDKGNWVALAIGHLLEDLVAKIFEVKTGYPVYQIKKMFYHPDHPFMLADVDYFTTLPDGSTALVEIKTTNYNAQNHWWDDGNEIVPVYYETQGRHYMAVMDIDRIFYCCLYGNNENETIIREMSRDVAYEEEMIFLEENFWNNHVQAQAPPSYTEDGDLILKSTRRYSGPADENAPDIQLSLETASRLIRYLQLQEEKKNAEKRLKEIDNELKRLKAMIIAEMGTSCTAAYEKDGTNYIVTYNPIRKPVIDKDNLVRLKLQFPDIYKQFVTISESRRFNVKVLASDAA